MPFWLLLSFHIRFASAPVAAAYLFLVRSYHAMNRRFPVLSIISVLMRIIGWLHLALGLLLWALLIVGWFTRGGAGLPPVAVAGAAFGVVFGLLLVAAAESIGVLFAIEDNTHAAAEHAFKLVSEKNPPKI
jgi:hypothetical protein